MGDLDVRGNIFTERVVKCWHRVPREVWVLHPWRCSRPGWMGCWESDLVSDSLAHGGGGRWK